MNTAFLKLLMASSISTFLFSSDLTAEVFLGSSSSVGSITVNSNEVIFINSLKLDQTYVNSNDNGSVNIAAQISLNGTNHVITEIGNLEPNCVLAGPASITFPINTDSSYTNFSGVSSFPVCLSFQRIQGTTIQSFFADTNATLFIPAGKTCHFFPPLFMPEGSFGSGLSVSIQAGSLVVSNISISGGEEFSGPVTLRFGASYSFFGNIRTSPNGIISYYFIDDSMNLPSGAFKGPTGNFLITVEESSDLANWTPVMMQTTGASQSAFYRLNFSR